MDDDSPVTMDETERDAFLGSGGTGVVSLSTKPDEPPHAVPVSYGYDAAEETFYFRLAASPDGAKGDLADRPVAFVTYGDADGWHSVVARGRLEDVEAEGIEAETLAGLDRVDVPLVDVFDSPLREVSFEFYRLVPDELTARVEAETKR